MRCTVCCSGCVYRTESNDDDPLWDGLPGEPDTPAFKLISPPFINWGPARTDAVSSRLAPDGILGGQSACTYAASISNLQHGPVLQHLPQHKRLVSSTTAEQRGNQVARPQEDSPDRAPSHHVATNGRTFETSWHECAKVESTCADIRRWSKEIRRCRSR